jgi:hypothetical protein
MPTIFLSYRRSDTAGYAGRLTDALQSRFGKESVFQDIEAIAPGTDFVDGIDAALAGCHVLLVLIGDTWISERSASGSVRLSDPRDFVRLELASALRKRIPVLPVIVESAKMPAEDALPPELKPLARVQAVELSDTRWDYDVERVIAAIEALTGSGVTQKRKRALLLTSAGALVAVLAAAAIYFARNRPAELSGRWNLPNGSFWIVVQDGRRLGIEETHYDSKQVWKRGTGIVDRDRVDFALDLVYGGPRRYEGSLALSADGTLLSGTVRDTQSGSQESLALTRSR